MGNANAIGAIEGRLGGLRQRVLDLIAAGETSGPDFDAALTALDPPGCIGAAHAELIYLLSHLRIDPGEARACWSRILEHRDSMERRLGDPVDPRVALLDYFVRVHRQLCNPKIIEMKLFEETRSSAYRDELTDLYNFRFFEEHLAREVARCERGNIPLSLAMIDVDDFKHYNDRNGHDAGNAALAGVAGLVADSLRAEDIAARYGGEELVLVLPGTPKSGALQLAERIRGRIAAHQFPHASGQPSGQLTVSIGVATLPADAEDPAGLIRAADRAMYHAKGCGKNRVELFARSSRSHRRIDARLSGRYRFFSDEFHPLTTRKISEGGVLFVSDRPVPPNVPVQLYIGFPALGREIPVVGRVVDVRAVPDGGYEAAVSLEGCLASDRGFFARYVREATPAPEQD